MGFSHLSAIHGIPPALLSTPIILHGISASLHAVLLLVLSLLSVTRMCKVARPPQRPHHRGLSFYRETLFTCLCLGLFYLLFCITSHFWYLDGWWSNEAAAAAAEVDLAVRAIAWLAVYSYLSCSCEKRCPAFLRSWWVVFLLMSISFVVVDVADYIEIRIVDTHLWVLDFGSIVAGLIIGYAGFFANKGEEESAGDLQEPLLEGGSAEESNFANAGFFSLLTFSWMNPLFLVGSKKTLDLKDVPGLAPSESANHLFPIFKKILESHIEDNGVADSNTDSSEDGSRGGRITTLQLVKALVSFIRGDALFTAVLALVYTLTSYAGPLLIKLFIEFLTGSQQFTNQGYLLVSVFVAAKFLECLSNRHSVFRLQQAGLRIRAVLVAMIYRKGLTLSSQARQGRAIGEIVNIMSVDAERIAGFVWSMHDVWILPVEITLALMLLYYTLGLAFLAALAATFVVMFANVPLLKLIDGYQENMMKSKDARMKATSEILNNMKILKLQAWEMKFLSKIMELRKTEANWLKKFVYTFVMIQTVTLSTPTFIAAVTFITCTYMGIPLELGTVLSALATFKVLQMPIYQLPDLISNVIQTKVSLDRIATFLCLDGLQHDAVQKLPRGSSEVAIEVSNGNFSWDPSSETPTLRDLNFQMLRGKRIAICGAVGSGKSSLLSCILGEVPKVSGTVKLCGTVAYVAQSPWIQSGKIQENILFGKAMDLEKYDIVLEACSLKKDFERLPFGDETIIGERGINLSGGQKQRIQIARALYNDADIFIFDDPFSALDAHTGSHLFKECLLRLLASKTVVYVTHQVEFLPPADLILVMKDGRITQAGKYDDILNSGTDFRELVGAHKDAMAALNSADPSTDSSSNKVEDISCGSETRAHGLPDGREKKNVQDGKTDETAIEKGQLVQEEEREKGRVGLWVYWKYITMLYKGALVPVILLAHILFQVLEISRNYWMAWSVQGTEARVSRLMFIYIFIAFSVGGSFFILARSWFLATVGFKTGTILFDKMHRCIFRAPMSFFDSTPSGRILNRASSDQSDVDTSIPYTLASTAFSVIRLLAAVVVMSQVSWQVFIIFIPALSICIWYQQYYILTARELSRLVGVCTAPNIQHFSESLTGSMIIRSFDQESRFVSTNFDLMDVYTRPRFYTAGAMEWLCFRLDMFSSLTFAFSLMVLISLPRGLIDPAMAGLAVTYGLNLNTLQAMVIWSFCSIESKIISVERILQYSSIPAEPPLTIEAHQLDCKWPSKGEVTLHELQVRYAPHLPMVLRGVTCSFPGGKKSGVVGRTGCGKTTLIQTLFRIIDPSAGQIIIDGIDISTIGLHDLRSRLGIIPQDPIMFGGTVRSNLDPLGEYTDEQIWKALDCCQLGDEIRKKALKLESEVTENGDNWSVGQRQLVCLGRVILKKSKILVLDEATASVDTATDSLIQNTIRQQFPDSTVVIIAHRITSILNSDMVLLLDHGVRVEYDTPAKLLENKSSLFAKLVSEYAMRSS